MASNAPSNGMSATDVCRMFAQMAGQLFHPSTVINALRPVAEIYGVTDLPTEESILGIRRSYLNGHPANGAEGGAPAAAPVLANGKAGKKKKGDADGGEKKKRPGRISPYTMFSMSLMECYKLYGQHPKFVERRETLQEKAAAAKGEQTELAEKSRGGAGGAGAMGIAASFWSELSQERKDAWTLLYTPLCEEINKQKIAGTCDTEATPSLMKAFVVQHPKADISHFLGLKFNDTHKSLPVEPKEEKAGSKKKAAAGESPAAGTSGVKPAAPAAAAAGSDTDSEDESSEDTPPAAAKAVAKPVAVASPVAAAKPAAQQEGKKRKADAATTSSAAAPFKAVAAAVAPSSPPPQLSKKGAAKQSKKEEAAEVVATKAPEKASKKSKAAAAAAPMKVEPVKEATPETSEEDEEESSDE